MSKPHYNFKHKKQIKKILNDTKLSIDDTNVWYKDNHIYFTTKVCDESITKLINIINKKNEEFETLLKNELIESANPNNLFLHICSYGGGVNACFRGIDAIMRSKIPIYTIVDGYACSAGSMLAVSGKKRYMCPNSYVLIHQLSSTGPVGTFWKIKDKYTNVVQHMDDIYNLYLNNSKLNKQQLEEFMSHDLYWKTDKCIEYGLVDEVYI